MKNKKYPYLDRPYPRVKLHPATIKHMKKGHPWVTKDSYTQAFPENRTFLIGLDGRHEKEFALFIHDPNAPFGFLINALMLYFFAAPVENTLGSKRFLVLFYFAALGSVLFGLALSGVSGFNMPFMGMLSSLLALLVIFGLLNPEATILLMFILPVKAKYISYGTVLITVLTFLAKANPYGAYHLGGIFFGYLYFRGPKRVFDPNLIYLRYLQWQLKRKKAGFRVIDGDKENEDKPTYH